MLKRMLMKNPRLWQAYRHYRESRDYFSPSAETTLGFRFGGNAGMQTGEFEPVETHVISQLLQDVDVLVNVGANIGYYCCIALQRKVEVIAFEPLTSNLRCLYRNIQLNGWSQNFEIYPMAIGDQVGLMDIYGAGTGASLVQGWAGQTSETATTVPISTLDRVLGDRLNGKRVLVLIDVEGAELGVIRGAQRLLGQHPKSIWFVEISVNEHQPAGVDVNPNLVETFECFFEHGYQSQTAALTPRDVQLDEVRRVAETGSDSLQTHNFVFRAL